MRLLLDRFKNLIYDFGTHKPLEDWFLALGAADATDLLRVGAFGVVG